MSKKTGFIGVSYRISGDPFTYTLSDREFLRTEQAASQTFTTLHTFPNHSRFKDVFHIYQGIVRGLVVLKRDVCKASVLWMEPGGRKELFSLEAPCSVMKSWPDGFKEIPVLDSHFTDVVEHLRLQSVLSDYSNFNRGDA